MPRQERGGSHANIRFDHPKADLPDIIFHGLSRPGIRKHRGFQRRQSPFAYDQSGSPRGLLRQCVLNAAGSCSNHGRGLHSASTHSPSEASTTNSSQFVSTPLWSIPYRASERWVASDACHRHTGVGQRPPEAESSGGSTPCQPTLLA